MSDVLITPASSKIEFKDASNNIDGTIKLDSDGNLELTSPSNGISFGDTSSDVFIGNGTDNVDLKFEVNGSITGTSGVTLTLGSSNSNIAIISNNAVSVTGGLSVSGGTKNFRIPHPLVGLSTTKDLVHSVIEGPQMDLIYRGKTTLVGGISTVNLDTKSGMTEGTFVALNRDVQCFTTNETGWTNVKGSVTGNQLTIVAQENTCIDTISWMVIGERQDNDIKTCNGTDSDGNLIIEPDTLNDVF